MRSEQQRLLVRLGPSFVELAVRIHRPRSSVGTVFCLHSFSGTGEDFLGLAEHLARVGLTAICPDLIGRGRSAFAPDASAYTLNGYLQSIFAVMQFAEKKLLFVGTGFGALLALAVKLSSPSAAMSGLVLHEPLLSSSSSIAAGLPQILAAAKLRFGSRREADAYAMARLPAGLPEAVRHKIARERFKSFVDGYGFALDPGVMSPLPGEKLPDFDIGSELAKLDIPTLMLAGEEMGASHESRLAGAETQSGRIVRQRISQDSGDECFRILDDDLSSRISEFLARCCG